jgi:transcriptional regulator with XRE-family HTH domain
VRPSLESPEEFVVRVTRRIATLRRELGVTQDELAERLGTATRNIQRMEAGQNLTLHTLARVAAVLEVAPELLVNDGPLRLPRRRYVIPSRAPGHSLSEGPDRPHAPPTRSRADSAAKPRKRRR